MDTMSQFSVTQEDGFVRIVLPDAIGMDDRFTIENKIEAYLSGNNCQLVLDFSLTTALYSSGIGLLIQLQKLAKEKEIAIALVNVSKKFRDLLAGVHLDRVFQVYSTDVEFELSKDEIWGKKVSEGENNFIFIPQIEDGVYRLTFSGQMTSLHDLSLLSEFAPDESVEYYVFNLENLDMIDTYGAQLFNDFIEKIQNLSKKCILFGANQVIQNLFDIFPSVNAYTFFKTEKEALESITQ